MNRGRVLRGYRGQLEFSPIDIDNVSAVLQPLDLPEACLELHALADAPDGYMDLLTDIYGAPRLRARVDLLGEALRALLGT